MWNCLTMSYGIIKDNIQLCNKANVLYSGKLLQIWWFTTNLPKFYSPIAYMIGKYLEAGLKFAKIFFTNPNLAFYSPKFFTAKFSHSMVILSAHKDQQIYSTFEA